MFTKADKIRRLQDMRLAGDRLEFEIDSFLDSVACLIKEVEEKKNSIDEETKIKYVRKNAVVAFKIDKLYETLDELEQAWYNAENVIVPDDMDK